MSLGPRWAVRTGHFADSKVLSLNLARRWITPKDQIYRRLPFHRTRTVAWAVYEARLCKDGIRWTYW